MTERGLKNINVFFYFCRVFYTFLMFFYFFFWNFFYIYRRNEYSVLAMVTTTAREENGEFCVAVTLRPGLLVY